MNPPIYRPGDSAILAYPNDAGLKGVEIEIIHIVSKLECVYQIRVLKTNKIYSASEKQLKPLDDALTVVSWKDCAWQPK
jgi:hypothetical protein